MTRRQAIINHAAAKAVQHNLEQTTHENYPWGAHMFDILFHGEVDKYLMNPHHYSHVEMVDITDYIKFRQSGGETDVTNEEWLTHQPEQYMRGYLGPMYQQAHAIAAEHLERSKRVNPEIRFSDPDGGNVAAFRYATG